MQDDDWCEVCGSEECPGDCQPPAGETPEERLKRIQKTNRDQVNQQVQDLLVERWTFDPNRTLDQTLEGFEQGLARHRTKRTTIATRRDGTTYRK